MAAYPSGTQVTIPEGSWVTLGRDWGRVLEDTRVVLLSGTEIEPGGRVRQDTLVSTLYLSSMLSEDGSVVPIPAGTDLRIPAGLTVQVAEASAKTVPGASSNPLGACFFIAGIVVALMSVLAAGVQQEVIE